MDLRGPSVPLLAKDFKEPMDGPFILSGTGPYLGLDLHILMTSSDPLSPRSQAPSISNPS